MNNNKKMFFLLLLITTTQCQESGFWWRNKDVINSAAQSRSLKEQSAKIRTLPPRYRHEDVVTTTKKSVSLYERDTHEDLDNQNNEYKYDNNEPDCVCVAKNLCNENNTLITDGNGLIDERSFSLCGAGNICCRLPSKPISQKETTTTQRNFLNINLPNITNLLSTILRPVDSKTTVSPKVTTASSTPKCISKKGKRLQERILIDEEAEDGDETDLVGETAFSEYPWMIELLRRNQKTRSFEYKCGAVLISSTTALTANHCLKNKVPSNFLIRAGEWDRSSILEYLPHQDRAVSQIISHPQYYAGALYNDIAILKWNNPLKLDLNVQPICLPDENEFIEAGTKCIVTAWGKTDENSPTTDKLKFVKVPIVERKKCQKQFQDYRLGSRFNLHESFICAGGEEGLDACNNDGGSPLVCKRRNDDSYFLAGLVSWGLDCGIKDVPGAYTNIQNLLKWINSKL